MVKDGWKMEEMCASKKGHLVSKLATIHMQPSHVGLIKVHYKG
jgi:hypothetical protein